MKTTLSRLDSFVRNTTLISFVQTAAICLSLPQAASAQPVPAPEEGRKPQAPPTPPPIEFAPPAQNFRPTPPPEGNTPWSVGEPTDEEQLYLEYINRARANPPAEGAILTNTTDPDVLSAYTYFSVDLSLMQSQFNAIAAAPPVAMNAQLTAAARGHSGHMFTNAYQGHYETNGAVILNPGDRITAQGYNWSTYGENVYSYAESVFHGHAGFEVDWGPGPGGMQTPPGHRISIHNSAFREVGVGIVNGIHNNGTNEVGPQLVTQNFATRQSAGPLITGVVYYDVDGNGFYSAGEGIGGVTVQVPGSAYFAITANSGGYAVPVTTNGNYATSFSATGLTNSTTAVVLSLANVKVDYAPAYLAPVASGPNPAALNDNNTYSFGYVGGATNHQWERTRLVSYSAIEGAESGLANVTVSTSGVYSVIINSPVASGSRAFHLVHTNLANQSIMLNPVVLPRTNSQLTFAKRLGYAGSGETAYAQVTTNSGSSWVNLWSQAGTSTSGDTAYSRVTNSLATYAGSPVQIRFVYAFTSGGYYPQTNVNVGLCLDDIAVSNADQLQSPVTNNIPSGNTFVFMPTNSGDYLLRVRAQLWGRSLPWGPVTRVTATNLPALAVQFTGTPTRVGNQFQANFNVANYRAGTPFVVLKTDTLGSAWTTDAVATVQTVISNTQFRVTTTNTAARGFYRIQAN
jgi:hypothetical protein